MVPPFKNLDKPDRRGASPFAASTSMPVAANPFGMKCYDETVRQMDPTEGVARQYLLQRGINPREIEFEPHGSVPPDFLVRGRVAVEVRRLNQNEQGTDGHHGIEESSIPTRQSIEHVLRSIGPQDTAESWHVSYTILRRPSVRGRSLKKLLRSALVDFQRWAGRNARDRHRIDLDEGLRLELARSWKPCPSFFMLGVEVDRRRGGFLLSELIRNIPICIEEKSIKVTPHRHRYREWWLVLVDCIDGHLDPHEEGKLRSRVRVPSVWAQVVIISRRDPTRSLELCPSQPRQT